MIAPSRFHDACRAPASLRERSRRPAARALAIVIASTTASAALAAEFTVRVPVEVRDLSPNIKSFGVRCSLWRLKDKLDFPENLFAQGSTIIDLPANRGTSRDGGNSWRGIVTVTITLFPNTEVRAIKYYRCELSINNSKGNVSAPNDPDGKLKPGAQHIWHVEGPIPTGKPTPGIVPDTTVPHKPAPGPSPKPVGPPTAKPN